MLQEFKQGKNATKKSKKYAVFMVISILKKYISLD